MAEQLEELCGNISLSEERNLASQLLNGRLRRFGLKVGGV
jgi:hypothetical protein